VTESKVVLMSRYTNNNNNNNNNTFIERHSAVASEALHSMGDKLCTVTTNSTAHSYVPAILQCYTSKTHY